MNRIDLRAITLVGPTGTPIVQSIHSILDQFISRYKVLDVKPLVLNGTFSMFLSHQSDTHLQNQTKTSRCNYAFCFLNFVEYCNNEYACYSLICILLICEKTIKSSSTETEYFEMYNFF